MALLHYWNLPVRCPVILMKMAFHGLGMFYKFLKRTKYHQENDADVKRLAWDYGEAPPNGGNGVGRETDNSGTWIQLIEPPDRRDEPESTFREFLKENVKDVYEAEPSAGRAAKDRRRDWLDFGNERKIAVIDRDPENFQLKLERNPKLPELLIRPNTWQIYCQIRALQALQDAPSSAHLPLLRLFESHDCADWPPVDPEPIEASDWMVLTAPNRPGTGEQRRFVEQALGTPDFAFLEGPPGSGKTTAICELVLQLAKRGKRALLCASTHVAVDNVLERLMDDSNPYRDLLIPVRIGDRKNVSEKALRWQLERFVRNERERLLGELNGLSSLTPSQEALREALRHRPSAFVRLVLDAANLVCGTTIGILQHPDIRSGGHASPDFDVLIIDEASKTTFQEFLVPALLAKRWVIVGDPKQLSPYVDDDAMAVNIEACLPDPRLQDVCVDTFIAGRRGSRKRRAVVVAEDEPTRQVYREQCAARDVTLADADHDDHGLPTADIVIGTAAALERKANELPLNLATVRDPEDALHVVHRRADALRPDGRDLEEQPEWASEVGWRLAREYEQRFAEEPDNSSGNRRNTAERLRQEVEELLPVEMTDAERGAEVLERIDRVRRVALPSVLESLRYGFERDPGQRNGMALSDGLPRHVLEPRHVLLSTQHRMHPEIAAFSHEHVYEGAALRTPEDMADKRVWSYPRYAHRAVWRDVCGDFDRRFNRNEDEARSVVDELRHFDEWARVNPCQDGYPWEAAVLTFYRGHEREVRCHLRKWTGQKHEMRHFARGQKERPYLRVELCTIDRFQGHEADVVLISFARPHATCFLESPNRLNVALTRARYQRVVIGNRQGMLRARGTMLEKLARSEPWDTHIDRRQQ